MRQTPEGADLIGRHQAAIARDVSRENRHQPALGINVLGQSRPLEIGLSAEHLTLGLRPGHLKSEGSVVCCSVAPVMLSGTDCVPADQGVMSARGHSRPARAGTKPGHVRYAPIAIKFRSEAKCRDVPQPDSCSATN